MFLAIEGLSASLYALCAMMHLSITSSESAVKYFSLGAIASGLLLYGIVCLYGLVGDIDFDQLQYYFSNPYIIGENSQILQISLTFIIFGFLFKIAAFPGHV
jgi:NADH-quinone oxidoreductase subunit N